MVYSDMALPGLLGEYDPKLVRDTLRKCDVEQPTWLNFEGDSGIIATSMLGLRYVNGQLGNQQPEQTVDADGNYHPYIHVHGLTDEGKALLASLDQDLG